MNFNLALKCPNKDSGKQCTGKLNPPKPSSDT